MKTHYERTIAPTIPLRQWAARVMNFPSTSADRVLRFRACRELCGDEMLASLGQFNAEVMGAVAILHTESIYEAVPNYQQHMKLSEDGTTSISFEAFSPEEMKKIAATQTRYFGAGLEHAVRTVLLTLEDPFSFEQFTEHPMASALITALRTLGMRQHSVSDGMTAAALRVMDGDPGVEVTVSQVTALFHTVAFELGGKRVYRVSDGLAQRLALTELRGLRGADFRPPFRSTYIAIPEALDFRIYNSITGYHTLSGVYLTEDTAAKDKTPIPPFNRVAERDLRILLVGECNEKSITEGDDATAHFALPLFDDMPVMDILRVFVDFVTGVLAERVEPGERAAAKDPKFLDFMKTWPDVFNWIVNVVFYATSSDCEAEHIITDPEAKALWARHQKAPPGSQKRRELLTRYRKTNPGDTVLLGHSVEVDRSLPSTMAAARGLMGPLMVRTLVCGHFRTYHTGEGRKLVTRKWIEPHWRGPDNAPESIPDHVLK